MSGLVLWRSSFDLPVFQLGFVPAAESYPCPLEKSCGEAEVRKQRLAKRGILYEGARRLNIHMQESFCRPHRPEWPFEHGVEVVDCPELTGSL